MRTIEPVPRTLPLGWWGLSWYDIPSAPGSLAVVSEEKSLPLAAGREVWFMVWGITGAAGSITSTGWEARLDAFVAAHASEVTCWYLFDEPTAWGVTTEQLSEVAAHLPGSCIVMSISRDDLASGLVIPPAVTRIGINWTTSRGATPATIPPVLEQVASLGREMYLSLDATANPDASGACSNVTAEQQQASIDLNKAQIAWAQGRAQVKAWVAFVWRSEPPTVCGALDMPLVRSWIASINSLEQ